MFEVRLVAITHRDWINSFIFPINNKSNYNDNNRQVVSIFIAFIESLERVLLHAQDLLQGTVQLLYTVEICYKLHWYVVSVAELATRRKLSRAQMGSTGMHNRGLSYCDLNMIQALDLSQQYKISWAALCPNSKSSQQWQHPRASSSWCSRCP